MLKIGEFAALAQVSIRMLRYYDELGLLKPEHVDAESGYRYYSVEQLSRVHRIHALRDLGLTLDEVRHLLDDTLTAEELRGMLKLKHALLSQHITAEQARLRRVETRLRAIEDEGRLPDSEIVIKSQSALPVISLVGTGWIGSVFAEANAALREHGLSQRVRGFVGLYHGSLLRERPTTPPPVEAAHILDDEAALPPISLPDHRQMRVYTLPALDQVASLISTKPDVSRHEDFRLLRQWIHDHHFRLSAPVREIYLKRSRATETYITELLFPIEPILDED